MFFGGGCVSVSDLMGPMILRNGPVGQFCENHPLVLELFGRMILRKWS